MATLSKLRLAFTTKNVDDSGTDHGLNLTVNIDGNDIVDLHIGVSGLDDGEAVVTPAAALPMPIDTGALTNSSIRLGIRGDDAWAPEHVWRGSAFLESESAHFCPGDGNRSNEMAQLGRF